MKEIIDVVVGVGIVCDDFIVWLVGWVWVCVEVILECYVDNRVVDKVVEEYIVDVRIGKIRVMYKVWGVLFIVVESEDVFFIFVVWVYVYCVVIDVVCYGECCYWNFWFGVFVRRSSEVIFSIYYGGVGYFGNVIFDVVYDGVWYISYDDIVMVVWLVDDFKVFEFR